MLIFNEGVPGAGKSYDALVEHIVPAIKAGRRCFVRMKGGLNLDKIAEHCGLELAHVEELVTVVGKSDVRETFVAKHNPEKDEYELPDQLKNSLCVIDEVHEAYVSSRDPLPPEVEGFFAVHRHYGVDVVLMSQFYKRIHMAVRGRIEGKNTFQKLTAVGMDKSYRVTFWRTVSPDKYEKVGGETRKYDPQYFPLYRGVADDDVKTAVYKGGSKTVWAQLKWPAAIVAVLVIVGTYYLVKFFTGGADMLVAGAEVEPEPLQQASPSGYFQPEIAGVSPAAAVPLAKPDPRDNMSEPQRYVFELLDEARPRVSAVVGAGSEAWGVVEFRAKNQPPMEVLTTRQLAAMGFEVTPTDYGFLLEAEGQTIVATQWPTNEVVRSNSHELYRLDKEPWTTGAASASEASGHGPGVVGIRTPPTSVGSPTAGHVWGKAPETLRADWGG